MKNNILADSSSIHSCTGCSICAASCSNKAITIELTQDGFYEPVIDEELCIGCDLCKKSCYKFDEKVLHKNEKDCLFYSAINRNSEELKTATSGAVSGELMKQCIKQGYKVLGVAYDYDKNIAVTKIASSIEDIEQFKGSKYFQSYTLDAFYEALKDKGEQKYAVFGTPCQIYAISKYINLNNSKYRFLLVDIFCHGCPSMNLWTKYLEYNKRKLGIVKFDKIQFRSKSHGWHEYCNTFYSCKNKYDSSKINDTFYTIFFDKNVFNQACYTCKLRSTLSYVDIRLGDFWGYQYDTNTTGVSAVVLCTDKGKGLFEKVKDKFILKEYEFVEVLKSQSYDEKYDLDEEIRNYVLYLLSSDKSITEIMKEYKKLYSLNKKIKMMIKAIVKLMPKSISKNLRKITHIIYNK